MIKIGINGFGRIGRLVLRAILENYRDKIEVVAINGPGNVDSHIHLFKYDSTHGKLPFEVKKTSNGFSVLNNNINFLSEREPLKISWNKYKADIVLECTGKFKSKDQAGLHIKAGAKKVIISAPSKDSHMTVIYGVNNQNLKKDHNIISSGSCTTNCLAPLAKVLEDNLGIEYGHMTTIHSFTSDQRLLDKVHGDLRRARTASQSLIPTSTGAATAMGQVIPSLKGKLEGVSIRVPTSNVSLVDLSFVSKKDTSIEDINQLFFEASKSKMLKGILTINNEQLVSIDFNHNPSSCIFDATQTKVIKKRFCKISSWYDNEWGFSNRMCDTVIQLEKFL
ncbi:type I glyceraldehyde-3-phosphate dehydrogenase [Pelagibacteraceae bacterium]|nr:type I glyceraldehyde-3-phosphate dehydrogenase [Pelagibacteraceae bacterium]